MDVVSAILVMLMAVVAGGAFVRMSPIHRAQPPEEVGGKAGIIAGF